MARVALADLEVIQFDEHGDYPFVNMIKNHWEVGARRFLDQCSTEARSAAERQVKVEIPENRPTAVGLLNLAEKAGEDWAGKRIVALLTAEMQPKKPSPKSRRKRVA